MKITNEQHMKILDELRPEIQGPDDVTVKEAAEDWGVSTTRARETLEEAVNDGTLEKLSGVRHEGRKGVFYRRINKKDI